MRSRRRLYVVLGAVAALTFAGAAWAATYPIEVNAADQAAARAAVLKKSDFGGAAGWKGGFTKPDLSDEKCSIYEPRVSDLLVTGAAASEWTFAGSLSFRSETWLLKTPEMVKLDWQRTVAHPSMVPCFRELFGTEPNMKLISIKRIDLPKVAPLARRYRVLADYTQQGETVRLMVDLILIGKGRTEISLLTTAPYAERKAVQSAEVKLARALVARTSA